MWQSPSPPAERERVEVLESCGLLDSLPDPSFDRVTQLTRLFYGADVAFLGLVDGSMQWMKSRTSTDVPEISGRNDSICTLIIASGRELVIDDIRTSPLLTGHAVHGSPWRFYAGVPLILDGRWTIGTLCILSRTPGQPEGFTTEVLHDLAALSLDLIEFRRRNSELQLLSHSDKLTGLGNRRLFDEEIERACRRAKRTGEPASLILLDIDHFKQLNDASGHPAGDAALVRVASALRDIARRPDDVVARVGGEEFALILGGTDLPAAAERAEWIRTRLEAEGIAHPAGPRGKLTASLGVASTQSAETPDRLFASADRALYAAKAVGRNVVITAPAAE